MKKSWDFAIIHFLHLGAVHKRRHQSRGGGFAKRCSYLISLFSKSDDEGGGGSKIPKN